MKRLASVFGFSLVLVACGSETVVQRLDEKEANAIMVLLAESDISAAKVMLDTGRTVYFNINVPSGDKLKALRTLQTHDYPRRKPSGYAEVFSEQGLIPTSAEEKAKKIRALEGEIEKQLRLSNGILDAEVNIVIPEESPLKTAEDPGSPAKASVTLKYYPPKSLTTDNVQKMVAAAVDKLTPDHVGVIMAPAIEETVPGQCPPSATAGPGFFGRFSAKVQNVIMVVTALLVLLLGLSVVYYDFRLRGVRGRLIRLQNEIAKARRKGGEGSNSAPSVT